MDGIYTRAYTYDLNSRLATENYPGQPQKTNTYDWVGNKTSLPGSTYNAADQLASTTGHTYTYDGRGNMTSDNSTQYTYTSSNLLFTAGGSSMTWDAAGYRISFTTATNQTYTYVYDVTASIPTLIEEVMPTGSVYYVREPGGILIARVFGADIKYYGFDDLGSTLFLTDNTGTVTDKYTYDAWGNSTSHEESTQQPYQHVGRYGYYTHWQDANFGMLQLGVRSYDPKSERFTQRDPVLNEFESSYVYSSDKPTRMMDPTGLITMCCPTLDFTIAVQKKLDCARKWKNWWQIHYPWDKDRPPVLGPHQDKIGHCFTTCKIIKDCGFTKCEALALGGLPDCTKVIDDIYHDVPNSSRN